MASHTPTALSLFPLPPLPVPSPAQGADRDDRKQALASSRKGEGVGARLEHQLLSTPLPKPCTCRAAWRLVTPPLARQGRMDLEERPDPRPRPGNAGLGDGGAVEVWGNCRPPQRGKRQWLSVTRADPSPLVASFFSPPPPGLLCVCVCVGRRSFQGETSLLCSPRIWNPSQRGSALATFHVWGRGEEALKDTGRMYQHQGQANQSVPGWEARRGAAHTQPGTHGLPLALAAQAAAWRSSLQSTLSPDLPGICQSHLIPSPSLSLCQGLSRSCGACG